MEQVGGGVVTLGSAAVGFVDACGEFGFHVGREFLAQVNCLAVFALGVVDLDLFVGRFEPSAVAYLDRKSVV